MPEPFIIDIHTHIHQHDPTEVPAMLQRAAQAGVRLVLTAGVTVESSRTCVEMAHTYPNVLACVGLHPMDMKEPLSQTDYAALEEMARDPRVVAISETGLDNPDKSGPDHRWQEDSFRRHIRLARTVGKPVIFHNREAGFEPLRILREERAEEAGVVCHYFQGTEEYARACLDHGIYLSLSKLLLRVPELQEVVRWAPLDRLVLETDAYPQPFKRRRKQWTEPRDAALVAAKLAELKGITVEEAVRATWENAVRVLRLGET